MDEQHEDQKIWNNFITGDDSALGQLFERYANRLFNFGTTISADEEMIKDCIQDLFVKLITGKQKLEPVSNVKAYLFNALRNILLNMKRDEFEMCSLDETEMDYDSMEPSPENLIINSEDEIERQRITDALLSKITVRQREVLYYRYVENFSYEEICGLMKMNYQSVRNLLNRTMTKLRFLKKFNKI